MRVLLASYGSRGDVEPIAALAAQLLGQGVEVKACVPPDREFVELLDRYAIPSVPFPKSWRSWADQPSTAEEKVFSVDDYVGQHVAVTYPTLVEAAQDCDVMVASGMLHFVASSVAERVGIPLRFVLFSPSLLKPQPWQPLAVAPINAHRASINLPPISNAMEFLFTARPWLAADPLLSPLSDQQEMQLDRTGAWVSTDDRPLPRDLLAFLDAGAPPIYVGFGSMRMASDSARMAIEAIRELGHRIVLARGWSDLATIDAEKDCFSVGEVNQQALFPRMAAVVHHGGAGTTIAGAMAGIPQVVVPQAADQPYWASRVSALRIGAVHDGPVLTSSSLSSALLEALNPKVQKAASAMAQRIHRDGAAVAAKRLLDLVAQPLVTAKAGKHDPHSVS
ncbi:glycosyltransferase [Devosia sp. ZW T5_3]|uniref:glycosyltransferase n=1 Tax=Devosia sp. ZW T5_3 TaxID=3378085 RepID=UPI0038532968